MNAPFRPGDRVEVIDENLEGTVTAVKGNKIVFISDEGFEYVYSASRLVKKENFLPPFSPGKYVAVQKGDMQAARERAPEKKNTVPEIDLHAGKIPHLPAGLHPSEILPYQLRHLQHFIQSARKKQLPKFIVIHGEGTGKLRREALKLVRKAGYITYDAPYFRYGKGAFVAEKK